MATCPICSAPSAGKRISWGGFELFDLCVECTSYLACLVSSQVDINAKKNAVKWAETAIESNRSKIYLANCIKSWKVGAERFIENYVPPVDNRPTEAFQDAFSRTTAAPAQSRDIFSHSTSAEDPVEDPEAMPFHVSTEPDNGRMSELEEVCPVPEEEESTRLTDEEIEKAAEEFYREASKNFIDDGPDVKDYLREILSTLKSIDSRIEKVEKEIAELKK